MKVEELIEKLKNFPPQTRVTVYGVQSELEPVNIVAEEKVTYYDESGKAMKVWWEPFAYYNWYPKEPDETVVVLC